MELMPEELLLAALLRRAIKDEQDGKDQLRAETSRWLWTVAPAIAERAGLPFVVSSHGEVQGAAFAGHGG